MWFSMSPSTHTIQCVHVCLLAMEYTVSPTAGGTWGIGLSDRQPLTQTMESQKGKGWKGSSGLTSLLKQGYARAHYTMAHWIVSRWFLNVSSVGDTTISLGRLSQRQPHIKLLPHTWVKIPEHQFLPVACCLAPPRAAWLFCQ